MMGTWYVLTWRRICNAQNRSSRKQSTSVLLRNFYVGITPWNRCILDAITGGNFLGSHTFDAYTKRKIHFCDDTCLSQ